VSTYPQGPDWWQASDGLYYPPQQPQQPYGTQGYPYPYPPPAPKTSGSAIAALILAIASFVVCPVIAAIIALVLAATAKREIRESGGWITGEGVVTAAKVVAWIHLAVVSLVILAIIAANL
jgi:hypothetical protein